MVNKNIFQVFSQAVKKKAKKYYQGDVSKPANTSEGLKNTVRFTIQLERNIELINSFLGDSDDIIIRKIQIATVPGSRAAIIYIDSIIDEQMLESSVLKALTQGIGERAAEERAKMHGNLDFLLEGALTNIKVKQIEELEDALKELLAGNGLLIVNQHTRAISISIPKPAGREYAEPKTEKVVVGPQAGFVEDISTNVAMIRKRIKSFNLVIKEMQIGKETQTDIRVAYMKNIADPAIVDELFSRLKYIKVDGIFGSEDIEEYINDTPTNIFQTTFYTERPDRVQAMLLEGRIAILVGETPFAVVVPAVVADFFISPEDYYINPYAATFNRLLGYFGAFIVVFLPGIYVAVTTFHQEMLPTPLALTIAGTRAGVPYPAFVEALAMETAFEALRQAGTRLPTHVGQAVSIVGALIIGQAAVEAGLVSPAVVIVVATTAIFSFTIPYTNFSFSIRLLRFVILILAATLGIYGIMTGALFILINLMSLKSFGVHFLAPFAPLTAQDTKDWVFRFPQWSLTKRSTQVVNKNIKKKAGKLKPQPSNNE